MMRTADDIIALYLDRRRDYTALHRQMAHIKAVYTGDVEIPLPDMDKIEQSYVPNLLQSGVDQMAGRIASVAPQVHFPIHGSTRRAERLAETKRRVVTGWMATDQLSTKMKYRARDLIAYSNSPASVFYDKRVQRPVRHVRDPMMTYPAPDLIPGVVTPSDVIFAYTRSVGWCLANGYPQVAAITNPGAPRDSLITLVEYHDPEQDTLIAYAEVGTATAGWAHGLGGHTVLEQTANPIGMTTATVPNRIALEQSGQFDGMVGMYYMQAKLMALEVIAVERGIFPDTFLIGRPGEVPRVVAGPYDGRTGEITVISGGDIRTENPQPGYLTNGTIDRLERAQRVTSGIPSEFGGESPTNVRTGRRGDAVISATIDFPVAEAQEMLALALHDENMAAIALSKHYDGTAPRSIYVGLGNQRQATTYISEKVFEGECDHTVTYPISGADLNALMIGMGQRVGMGIMSKETAAELDPYIADAEVEHDRITAEGLEQALMSGLQQQAAAGAIPPMVLSKIMRLVKTDRMELPEAIEFATEWYAKIEAAEAEDEAEDSMGEQATAPAAMAALAGADPMSPIPGASPGQADLSSLMSALRKPTMTVEPMRGMARGAV